MDKVIAGVIIEKSASLTLEELCHAIHVQPEIILQLVEYQLIRPEGETAADWRFDSLSLKRSKIAASFYHDLAINMEGIALALELLDQIEHLQQQIHILEKYR